MKKGVIAAAVVAALVGLGAAAVPLVERYAADRIKAELERDGTTKVAEVEVGLFARGVTLVGLQSKRAGTLSIGRWQASGLAWPIGELLQGRTPLTGFRLGDPLQASRIELTDVRMAEPPLGATWSIGSLVIEGFDLNRYDGHIASPYVYTALVARIAGALSFHRLEEKNVVFVAPLTGDTTAFGALVVERYERGKFGSIALVDLAVTPAGKREPAFKMAEAKATGLDLVRVVSALSAVTWKPGSPMGRASLASASATGFGGELMSRYGISLGSITHATVHESAEVGRSRVRIDGFVLAPPLRGLESLQVRLFLQSMGLKELKLGFDCAGTEDRTRNEVTIDRCALAGTDLGEINLTGKLVKIDPLFWEAIDTGDTTTLAFTTAALGSARLVLADNSLLDRSLKALAAATGQPVAVTRANLARDVRRFQPAGVLITEDLTKLLDTVARFAEQGGKLTIDAKPEPPFGIDKVRMLQNPGPDLVEALGLSATLSR